MGTTPAPRILLVDDNRERLVVNSLLLEDAGFQVQSAPNGEEALDLFASTRFDVVVTDYRVPQVGGGELIARLRALDSNVRIILLSAFVEPLGLTEANTGADAVISKSANEGAHLLRWVKRLATTLRKPMVAQDIAASSFRIAFNTSLSPEEITGVLSALADYYRACGGVGLQIDFDLEEVAELVRLGA